jgi:branched-chain amino acid transport system substrate-binding protein
MRRRVVMWALSVALVAAAGGPTLAPQQRVLAQDGQGSIKIGLDVPYTGPDAFEGVEISQGVQLAVDEQNAAGGIGGRQLETILGDNQCDPGVGVNSARRLIDVDQVDVMIGSGCSSVTLAVMPLLLQGEVPSLDVTATNPQITADSGVGGNPWKFRLNLNDEMMAGVFAERVIEPEVSSLAIFAVQTDYGRGAVAAFKEHLPDVSIVAEEYFPLGQADFRSLVTKVKDLNPEGLLIIGDYPEASQIITQAREVGLDNIKLYGRGTVVTPEMLALLQDPCWAEGAKEANFWAPNPDSQDLADRYKAKFGDELTRTAGMGYYGAKTLFAAMEAVDGTIDRQSIRDALEAVDIDLPGLGHVNFDDHHQAHYPMYINGVQDCEVVALETVPTDEQVPGTADATPAA